MFEVGYKKTQFKCKSTTKSIYQQQLPQRVLITHHNLKITKYIRMSTVVQSTIPYIQVP